MITLKHTAPIKTKTEYALDVGAMTISGATVKILYHASTVRAHILPQQDAAPPTKGFSRKNYRI